VSTWKKKAGPTEVSARQESNWLVPAKSTTLASAKIFRKRLHTHWIETRAQLNGLVCVWFRAFLVELGIHISVLHIFTGCLYILYILYLDHINFLKKEIYIYILITIYIKYLSGHVKNIMVPGGIWYGITYYILIHGAIYLAYHAINLNISWYIEIPYTPSRDICWLMNRNQWKATSNLDNRLTAIT